MASLDGFDAFLSSLRFLVWVGASVKVLWDSRYSRQFPIGTVGMES
jgi:hypothetical protein